MFQHTAARRRLRSGFIKEYGYYEVSTHSRPKAAAAISLYTLFRTLSFNTQPPEGGCDLLRIVRSFPLGFNTQPPEGGCKGLPYLSIADRVSTHSRPKAAASTSTNNKTSIRVSTHSRPKAAAFYIYDCHSVDMEFQHTAARRRLQEIEQMPEKHFQVSTHSRPKAAACGSKIDTKHFKFQHTAARRRLLPAENMLHLAFKVSTHSRPKAAAPYLKKQEKSVY